jgi:DNA-binding beta-propeller fold protein YncE
MRNWMGLVAAGAILAALGCVGCGPPDEPVTDNCTGEAGSICTYAGTGVSGFNGDGLHRAATEMYRPFEIEFAPDGTPFVMDWNNHRVRKIVDDKFVTVIGNDFIGDGPDDFSDRVAPGAPGGTVTLNHPTDIAFNPVTGAATLLAWHNHKLRDLDIDSGLVLVTCGAGPGFAGDGGPAAMGRLRFPISGAYDDAGNLYFIDAGNQRIRKIDTAGIINTVAGTGTKGWLDGDAITEAMFAFPSGPQPAPGGGLTIGPDGNIYVADVENNRIRVLDLTTNTVTTIAGTGLGTGIDPVSMLPNPKCDTVLAPAVAGTENCYTGDGGAALDATLNDPNDLAFGPDGNLYIADWWNSAVRVIDMGTMNIDTFVGGKGPGYSGDGGPASAAALAYPTGVSFGPDGNLYIADWFNSRIRKVEM